MADKKVAVAQKLLGTSPPRSVRVTETLTLTSTQSGQCNSRPDIVVPASGNNEAAEQIDLFLREMIEGGRDSLVILHLRDIIFVRWSRT